MEGVYVSAVVMIIYMFVIVVFLLFKWGKQ